MSFFQKNRFLQRVSFSLRSYFNKNHQFLISRKTGLPLKYVTTMSQWFGSFSGSEVTGGSILKSCLHGRNSVSVVQCFSTEVPRNLGVPWVATRVSTETDRNCLGRISQRQFYCSNTTCSQYPRHYELYWKLCLWISFTYSCLCVTSYAQKHELGSLQRVPRSSQTFTEGPASAKALGNTVMVFVRHFRLFILLANIRWKSHVFM